MIPTKIFGTVIAFLPAATAVLEGADASKLGEYGLFGIILGWFMFRHDKRLAAIEHRMTGLNRTMLVEILSRPSTNPHTRRVALEELRKVDPSLAESHDA